jgi:phage replication initiation protein
MATDFLKSQDGKKIQNTLCIDWFQATFKRFPKDSSCVSEEDKQTDDDYVDATPAMVARLVGLELNDFDSCPGQNMYREGRELNGIKIFYQGFRDGMGVNLCMTGKGCRFYESMGLGEWEELIKFIAKNYHPMACMRAMQLTRIDLAYDDFNCVLPLDTVSDYARNGNYVSRCHRNKDLDGFYEKEFFGIGSYDLGKSKVDLTKGCDEKHFTQSDNPADRNNGHTVYFGTRRSNMMLRFYDKKAEQERTDLKTWVRCELVLRRSCANGFALKFLYGILDDETGEVVKTDISRLYFGILNQYIRFVEPNPGDDNRRRWVTADFWSRFIGNSDEIAVFIKPGGTYTSANLENYVIYNCGTSIASFIALYGASSLIHAIDEFKQEKLPNKKQQFVLRESFGEEWEKKFKMPGSDFELKRINALLEKNSRLERELGDLKSALYEVSLSHVV